MRNINRDAINKLTLCVEIAEELKGKDGMLGPQDLEKIMPRFTWLVRDFNLDLVDEEDQQLSEQDYLEKALTDL